MPPIHFVRSYAAAAAQSNNLRRWFPAFGAGNRRSVYPRVPRREHGLGYLRKAPICSSMSMAAGKRGANDGPGLLRGSAKFLTKATTEGSEKLWARREFSNSLRHRFTKLNQDIVVPRVNWSVWSILLGTTGSAWFPRRHLRSCGDGNIHVIMVANYDDPSVRARVEQALDDLFAQVLRWGGVITGEHGIGLAKKRWWPEATSDAVRALHERLKQVLDPLDVLNPGKFVG